MYIFIYDDNMHTKAVGPFDSIDDAVKAASIYIDPDEECTFIQLYSVESWQNKVTPAVAR